MHVIVKFKDFSPSLETRSRTRIPVPAKVLQIISSLGFEMQPLHPDTDDAGLRSFYAVEVPDQQTANGLIARLVELPGVDGAYLKPSDALP
jgi:hypothetical protein